MALGLSAVVVLGGGALAAADTEDDPSAVEYPDDPKENLALKILEPICDGDVPYLGYDAVAESVTPGAVTITFVNPTGDDHVLTDQPLSGRVLWPGAEVDGAGNPVDWPGWRLVDGEWVVGDQWDWVRPSVEVVFQVGPLTTRTVVAYPSSAPNCEPPGSEDLTTTAGQVAGPPDQGQSSFLPRTGAEILGLLAVAAGLLAVGAAVVTLVRRHRSAADAE